jgi:hypothetical protein
VGHRKPGCDWLTDTAMRQVDVGTVIWYSLTLMFSSFAWTSRSAAALTLLLWTKVFYFLKVGPAAACLNLPDSWLIPRDPLAGFRTHVLARPDGRGHGSGCEVVPSPAGNHHDGVSSVLLNLLREGRFDAEFLPGMVAGSGMRCSCFSVILPPTTLRSQILTMTGLTARAHISISFPF